MKNFRTYQSAKEFYKAAEGLKMKGCIKNQFDRALLSIVLNLSEGSAKPSSKDRRRFYYIALGSLREVQTILDLIGHQRLILQADRLGAHLYRLCHSC
ncbi:MAG: four helix bundle protein [Deltaproteobacteria bacterium]|nr:four helix bundle protein [Deltaproteobacteria bacterium]